MIVTTSLVKRVIKDEPGLTINGYKTLDAGYWSEDHGEFFTPAGIEHIQHCVDFLARFQSRGRAAVSSVALRDEVAKVMPDVDIQHGCLIVAVLLTRLRYKRRPDRADIDVFLPIKEWMRQTSRQMSLLRPLEAPS
ncbi:MAG: hypothetical protein HQK58_12125 [Deltaproteobacteria bacterium]|nr:hypothetical protein [Deltaproteobacteria bacterium]MBF0549244.1 hypothetical protein [Deltaproteobacteria bacterium]